MRELNPYSSIEKAILAGEIQGLVLAIRENETPFSGLLSWMDRRLKNEFSSHFQKSEFITGKKDECIYIPLQWNQKTLHFLLIGVGNTQQPNPETFKLIQKNIKQMKLPKLGISASHFGSKNVEILEKSLNGNLLWMTN